jgi:hypothetical protein
MLRCWEAPFPLWPLGCLEILKVSPGLAHSRHKVASNRPRKRGYACTRSAVSIGTVYNKDRTKHETRLAWLTAHGELALYVRMLAQGTKYSNVTTSLLLQAHTSCRQPSPVGLL